MSITAMDITTIKQKAIEIINTTEEQTVLNKMLIQLERIQQKAAEKEAAAFFESAVKQFNNTLQRLAESEKEDQKHSFNK